MSDARGGGDGVPPREQERLSRGLHRSNEPAARMQAGVDLAVELIDGCDHAGLTMVDGGVLRSGASSDRVAIRADELQNQLGTGPCVEVAQLEHRTSFVSDLQNDQRWLAWGQRVYEELQVDSLLSLLLYSGERSFGALNLYSGRGRAFDVGDFAMAETLAAHLAAAVSDSQEIENRNQGMITRTVIGQAEGILMERYGIGPDEAFSFLRRASQETNQKLALVAEQLVWTRELPKTLGQADTTT
ncbi:GAF and ANTAR domain-containing protein [Allobranchiibius sp. CTAmp26]|uniref:GAF and ANTAR domain-containing protein n=1 Tax=Allobranchiibius sp. CTAmp26 TaxID=2815214 RepID=UPI001AA16658|nr:GAF and ANTAR domain-containing protein [Allobranchiibius sp. CTAmp26]MBO1756505.1 GAF and ANTAR domain-containing protein [Allobranchiibius sp. CTAmp26]